MNNQKPILGITMGDPASIGPEVAVKAFAKREIYDTCRPLVVGDARVIEDAINFLRSGSESQGDKVGQ